MNKWRSHKKIKKDYQCKNLKNPFFRKKEKGRSSNFWKWMVLLALIIVAALVWFFLISPVWRLKNINIQGLTRMDASEIKNIIIAREANSRLLFFKESNFFLFKDDAAKAEILDKYNFSDLQINKKIPNTIELKINERPYSFIFQQGSDFFYSSSDGYIMKEIAVTPEDMTKYFILENKSDSITIGEKNKISLKEEYLNFVLDLNNRLMGYTDMPVEKFIIDQELNSIIVKFKNGPSVYFSVKSDAGEQVE